MVWNYLTRMSSLLNAYIMLQCVYHYHINKLRIKIKLDIQSFLLLNWVYLHHFELWKKHDSEKLPTLNLARSVETAKFWRTSVINVQSRRISLRLSSLQPQGPLGLYRESQLKVTYWLASPKIYTGTCSMNYTNLSVTIDW